MLAMRARDKYPAARFPAQVNRKSGRRLAPSKPSPRHILLDVIPDVEEDEPRVRPEWMNAPNSPRELAELVSDLFDADGDRILAAKGWQNLGARKRKPKADAIDWAPEARRTSADVDTAQGAGASWGEAK